MAEEDATHSPGAPLENGSFTERIASRLATMSRAERVVAEYLRARGRDAIFATAEQIGAATKTSDATVVRTAKTLGYSGLLELRHSLAEQAAPDSSAAHYPYRRADAGNGPTGSGGGLLARVFTEATERLAETWRLIPEAEFARAVELIVDAREVLGFGIGPSGLLARYLALRLTRSGRRARASEATGFRLADDLTGLGAGDLVVLYLPSRLLGEIEVLLNHAHRVGARTLLISDSLGALFAGRVDVALPATHSSGDVTGEMLSAEVLTDALLLGVRSHDEQRTAGTAELLTALRSELIGGDSRDHVHRRDRAATRRNGLAP